MLKRTLPLIATAFLFAVTSSAQAQSKEPEQSKAETPAAQTQAEPEADTADVAITANVTARELKFEVVPNPDVKFTGKPERKTVWDAVRQNLPKTVQPGVTYRNIGIRLKIVSVFADIDRIVAEALGETPITDNIPPPTENAPQQNAQPQSSQPQSPPPAKSTQPPSTANTPAGKERP